MQGKITVKILMMFLAVFLMLYSVISIAYAACSCNLTLTATDLDILIASSDTSETLNIPIDLAVATLDTSGCEDHEDQDIEIVYAYEVVSELDCNVAITDSNMTITLANGKSTGTAIIKVAASAADQEKSQNVTVTITKASASAPIIESAAYNPETGEIKVRVKPNGNRTATLYVEGFNSIPITFERKFFVYQTAEITIKPIEDDTKPLGISNVAIQRKEPLDLNNKKAIISWTDLGDGDDIRKVYAVSGANRSADSEVNIKSDTIKTIRLYDKLDYESGGNSYKMLQTSDSSIEIPLDLTLHWDTCITIVSTDQFGNSSTEKVSLDTSQVNPVIYNPTIEIDYANANEGEMVDIDVQANDIHDPLYPSPSIKEAEFIEGIGEAAVLTPGSGNSDYDLDQIRFVTVDGEGAVQVKIKYTYEKVREDIPPAEGYIIITVDARNQEPVAVDDPVTVTANWGINYVSGQEIRIPATKILANDLDREDKPTESSPVSGIRIANISHEILGDIYLENGDGTADTQYVVINPSSSVSGIISFRYTIIDSGNLFSLVSATVQINLSKPVKAPVAEAVTAFIEAELDASGQIFSKSITTNIKLNVTDESNGGYTLKDVSTYKPYVNGSPATSAHKILIEQGYTTDDVGRTTPYIKLIIGAGSSLKEKDVITFNYTIGTETSTSQNTITATITTDGEPNEGYLYVHRRPLALFTPKASVTNNIIQYCVVADEGSIKHEASYDLDHEVMHSLDSSIRPSYSISGIRAWEWGVRFLDESTWTVQVFDAYGKSGGASSPGGTTNYGGAVQARAAGLAWVQQVINNKISSSGGTRTLEISLRVRDVDATISDEDLAAGTGGIGVWSEPKMMIVTGIAMKPVANFRTDKSYYLVPKTYTKGDPSKSLIKLTDLSYDPNGDEILEWHWELKNEDGTNILLSIDKYYGNADIQNVQTQVSDKIYDLVQSAGYNPSSPNYTLTLKVVENTAQKLESDVYSYTFMVYKDNEQPSVTIPVDPSNPDVGGFGLGSTLLFEDDTGKDGYIGDNKGKTIGKSISTTPITSADQALGTPNWSEMFKVTDDQSLSRIETSWLFEGQSVPTRKDWVEENKIVTTKSYSGIIPGVTNAGTPVAPFSGTVSANGLLPAGAYKVSVSIKDNPDTNNNIYAPDSAKTTYISTYGEPPDAPPYHLFIVPALEMYTTVECNGWMLQLMDEVPTTGTEDAARYDWVRVEDGKTREELGIALEDIVPTIGDTLTIRTVTNKYVNEIYCYNDLNKNEKYDTSDELIEMKKVDQNLDTTINWIGEYLIEDVDEDDPGSELAKEFDLTTLMFRMHGATLWGDEEQTEFTREKDVPVPVIVLPVKLYDFRITDVTDPNIVSDFNTYLAGLQSAGDMLEMGKGNRITDGVLVGHLALESKDYTDSNYLDMRKGYSFYFQVSSKGMKKDGDQVRITPKFYAVDDDGNILDELVGYVPGQTGKYVPYTISSAYDDPYIYELYGLYYEGSKEHNLNNHSYIVIGTDLREENGTTEQIWYGRYGVPADAKFFKLGETNITTLNEWQGKVLISFQLEAYKDGKCRYNYVEKGQWLKERNYIQDANKTVWASEETKWFNQKNYYGAVIVIDTSRNIRDDYTSNPVWRD